MLKPIAINVVDIRQPSAELATATVNNVFKVFHGFYGNLFLNKFSNGVLSPDGDDTGIISARKIWAYGLRDFDMGVIKTALNVCQSAHPEFPPSLPQFVALCRAAAPRKTYAPDHSEVKAIPMGQALRSQYARQAREINARHAARAASIKTGFVELPISLDGLKQAIAGAVGLAGGDESETLLRLDRQFSARSAA